MKKLFLISIAAVLVGVIALYQQRTPLGGVEAVVDSKVTTTGARSSSLAVILSGLSIQTVASEAVAEIPDTTVADNILIGRQLKGAVTKAELDDLRGELKNAYKTRKMSVNEVFAMEDIINFNCPNGFSVGEINGRITSDQVGELVSGNCGI